MMAWYGSVTLIAVAFVVGIFVGAWLVGDPRKEEQKFKRDVLGRM
jgi:hypothetical protein